MSDYDGSENAAANASGESAERTSPVDPADNSVPQSAEEFATPQFQVPEPNIEIHAGQFDPNRVRMMVYGESGAGKTVFAATWPNPIFFDLDDGMASIQHEVARIGIHDWTTLQEACMFIGYSKHNYKTLVIDSLNEGQWQSMQHVINSFPAIRRSYDNLPSMSDYGKALDDFDKFVRFTRSLPINVVYIAQLAKQDNPDEMMQPQFTGKSTAQNISRMMDVIGYIYKMESNEPVKPRIMTFDDSRHLAKDRSGALPPQIDNPTYAKLSAYWNKHREE